LERTVETSTHWNFVLWLGCSNNYCTSQWQCIQYFLAMVFLIYSLWHMRIFTRKRTKRNKLWFCIDGDNLNPVIAELDPMNSHTWLVYSLISLWHLGECWKHVSHEPFGYSMVQSRSGTSCWTFTVLKGEC
jgi:hypothetical protein